MKRPIFYFDSLKPWDIWTIFIYVAISICLIFGFYKIESDTFNGVLFFYTIATHLFLYIFNYRSLRNFRVYLIWFFFAILQLIGYFLLKDNHSLKMANGHAANGLRDTTILLFVFQILRIVSLIVQHQEFVSPSRGSSTDIFDERRVNWLDNILFLLYIGCGICLILI